MKELAIGAGIILLLRYAFNQIKGGIQDATSKTILGSTITRSVEGEKNAGSVMEMRCLSNAYRNKILSPEFHLFELYNVDSFPDDTEPAMLAGMIIDSNYRIFSNDTLDNLAAWGLAPILGAIDNPTKLMDAFSAIKTQVQALQVNFWYFSRTGKDLSKGVQWLPDSYMIQLGQYLEKLPVGLENKTTGNSLTELPNI